MLCKPLKLERETRLELATPTLARSGIPSEINNLTATGQQQAPRQINDLAGSPCEFRVSEDWKHIQRIVPPRRKR